MYENIIAMRAVEKRCDINKAACSPADWERILSVSRMMIGKARNRVPRFLYLTALSQSKITLGLPETLACEECSGRN